MAKLLPISAAIQCVDLAEYTRLMNNLQQGKLPNVVSFVGNAETLKVEVVLSERTVVVP